MDKYTYLAGPMEDLDEDQMTQWRRFASAHLRALGINALDPTRRVSFHDQLKLQEQSKSMTVCRRIFKQDLQDIANATVVLADVRRSSGRGTGTSMELMFAHMKNKIIILWADENDFLHPFYESMYTEKHFTLEDCLTAVEYYYDKP